MAASEEEDMSAVVVSEFSLKTAKPQCEAVIFDMDGLMIDTEPFWRLAEMEEFKKVGVELTEEDCIETTGIRIGDITRLRHSQKPWDESALMSCDELAEKIIERVVRFILEEGIAKEGLAQVIDLMAGKVKKFGIASSSSKSMIEATLKRLSGDIPSLKMISVQCSAQKMEYGKPHPMVYIEAMKQLGVSDPRKCLVFEDSLTGTLSAKSARMVCVSVPENYGSHSKGFAIADTVLPSLKDFTEDTFSSLFST